MEEALTEWTVKYIKNKDLVQRRLISTELDGDAVICKYKAGDGRYIIMPILTESLLERITEGETGIVCLNKKENLAFLTRNWDTLKTHRRLSFIFVNPLANERWIVFPYTHDMITEKPALARGLEAIFQSVPEV